MWAEALQGVGRRTAMEALDSNLRARQHTVHVSEDDTKSPRRRKSNKTAAAQRPSRELTLDRKQLFSSVGIWEPSSTVDSKHLP